MERILYDGVISNFEDTYHGRIDVFYQKNTESSTENETELKSVNLSEDVVDLNNVVLRDTILRQMIVHEVHGEGLGPDWGYQDSVELLLGALNMLKWMIEM